MLNKSRTYFHLLFICFIFSLSGCFRSVTEGGQTFATQVIEIPSEHRATLLMAGYDADRMLGWSVYGSDDLGSQDLQAAEDARARVFQLSSFNSFLQNHASNSSKIEIRAPCSDMRGPICIASPQTLSWSLADPAQRQLLGHYHLLAELAQQRGRMAETAGNYSEARRFYSAALSVSRLTTLVYDGHIRHEISEAHLNAKINQLSNSNTLESLHAVTQSISTIESSEEVSSVNSIETVADIFVDVIPSFDCSNPANEFLPECY